MGGGRRTRGGRKKKKDLQITVMNLSGRVLLLIYPPLISLTLKVTIFHSVPRRLNFTVMSQTVTILKKWV